MATPADSGEIEIISHSRTLRVISASTDGVPVCEFRYTMVERMPCTINMKIGTPITRASVTTVETAVASLKPAASDYVKKPV